MFYGREQFNDPNSRFTNEAVFVVEVREPAGGDWITDAEIEDVAAEASNGGGVDVRPFRATVGRGASGSAIGLLVDLGVNVGAAAVIGAVVAVWKRIRHRRPLMSVGALR